MKGSSCILIYDWKVECMAYDKLNALVAVSCKELSAQVCEFLIDKGIARIRTADSMYEAIDYILEDEVSLFVIDGQLLVNKEDGRTNIAGVDFVRFIRMCKGDVSEAHIIFYRSSSDDVDLIEANVEILEARQAGATCILQPQFNAERFEALAEPFLIHPQLFVRTSTYVGPCRRLEDVMAPVERRIGRKSEKSNNEPHQNAG